MEKMERKKFTVGALIRGIRYEGLRLQMEGRILADNGTEYVVTFPDGRKFGTSKLRHQAFERAYAFLMSPESHGVKPHMPMSEVSA